MSDHSCMNWGELLEPFTFAAVDIAPPETIEFPCAIDPTLEKALVDYLPPPGNTAAPARIEAYIGEEVSPDGHSYACLKFRFHGSADASLTGLFEHLRLVPNHKHPQVLISTNHHRRLQTVPWRLRDVRMYNESVPGQPSRRVVLFFEASDASAYPFTVPVCWLW